VTVDDHSFAILAELFAVMGPALRLHAHLMKDAGASPGTGCSDFAHSPSSNAPTTPSICPSVQVFRKRHLATSLMPGQIRYCHDRTALV
jgi:hypothetical protein